MPRVPENRGIPRDPDIRDFGSLPNVGKLCALSNVEPFRKHRTVGLFSLLPNGRRLGTFAMVRTFGVLSKA